MRTAVGLWGEGRARAGGAFSPAPPGASGTSPVVRSERVGSRPRRGQVGLGGLPGGAVARAVWVECCPATCLALRLCLLPRNGVAVWGRHPPALGACTHSAPCPSPSPPPPESGETLARCCLLFLERHRRQVAPALRHPPRRGGPAAGHCLLPLGPASRSCRRAPVRPRPPTAGLGDLETGAGEPCGLDVSPFQFRFASRRLVLKCRRCDFSGKSAALTLCPPGVLSGGTRSLCHTAWRPPGPLDSRPRLPGLTVRPPAACVVWSVRGVRFETR